ncbi:glutathione S-transferase family protein [Reyranella sp.]|uniref:glutathione S-transferase family protein n=1 Tax=Reyranella sp. TaxID=1929291 RepID=UPI0037834096
MATYRYLRAFTAAPDPAVLAFLRRRLDDFLGILDGHLADRSFVIGERATIADISLMAYLSFPVHESGYDLAASRPAIAAWLARLAELPGWQAPYDLLPGKRLHCHV